MFGLFKKKDPLARLRADYVATLERARDVQRAGDIRGFAALTAEAEAIGLRIEELERQRTGGGGTSAPAGGD